MTREQIEQYITDEEILLADGLDEAFIGITDEELPRAVYSVDKIIEVLSRDMTEVEAWEYYDFNIGCAYVGERTPLFIRTP
jgi:hypothetical protein